MLEKASRGGVLSTENEDVRSLREMIYEELALTLDDSMSADALVALILKTGELGVKTMALLDEVNTSKYGNPEITSVNIGVRNNPGILISGHDLTDLEQHMEQTKDTGVDVYTHGEMLPAPYYPFFKKHDNFAGNYGGCWWQQVTEFETYNKPILFTTNCIVPPRSEEIKKRIFTSGASGCPECSHITVDEIVKRIFLKSLRWQSSVSLL